MDLSSIAKEINPQVRGWVNYYGAFYRSDLRFLAWRINEHLARWAMHNSSGSAGGTSGRWSGCSGSTAATSSSSSIGNSLPSLPTGLWEPDDGRLSRPVLRAGGGGSRPPLARIGVKNKGS
jgi:hypothetical protein